MPLKIKSVESQFKNFVGQVCGRKVARTNILLIGTPHVLERHIVAWLKDCAQKGNFTQYGKRYLFLESVFYLGSGYRTTDLPSDSEFVTYRDLDQSKLIGV